MNRDFLPVRDWFINRPRVEKMVSDSFGAPFVSVVAGPGYGKTLAVAAYAKRMPQRLIWLRIRCSDNDMPYFWEHFREVTERELPGLAEIVAASAPPITPSEYDFFIRRLACEINAGPPVVLVVDDYEGITDPLVHAFFDSLMDAELDRLCITVISNEKLPMGGAMPSRRHYRISAFDLKYTVEEAGEMFCENGIELSQKDLEKAVEGTGGWPLALHLMCMKGGDVDVDILKEKTHQQISAELFNRNYFMEYDELMKDTLVKLSFFAEFPIELIKVLVGEDKADAVTWSLSINAFIDYNYTTRCYTFQHMYREFLAHRQVLLPKDEVRRVFMAAGRWFLDNGVYQMALSCFWRIREYGKYLEATRILPVARSSVTLTEPILKCLNEFPPDMIRDNIMVDFSRAFLYMNNMQMAVAESLLQSIRERLEADDLDDEENRLLLGDVYATLADLELFMKTDRGLAYIIKAREYLPNGCRTRLRNMYLIGNNHLFYLPDNKPGSLQRMVEYCFTYAEYADVINNGGGFGYEWLFAASAAYFTKDILKARECCMQAIAKASLTDQHDMICNAYIELMRMGMYNGDYIQARHWLSTLAEYIESHGLSELAEMNDCAHGWFYMIVGDFGRVAAWIKDNKPLSEDRPLETGRNKAVIIFYMFLQGRYGEALAEITRMEELYPRKGMWHSKIIVCVIKALVYMSTGDPDQAIAAFRQAYDMAYANNIQVIFAEFGRAAQKILRLIRERDAEDFDLDWLDEVDHLAISCEKRYQAVTKAYNNEMHRETSSQLVLKKKEKDILIYMAQGMTRDEIAQHMSMSLASVKRYITNIYTKLGAVNRADAIHIAMSNSIISQYYT